MTGGTGIMHKRSMNPTPSDTGLWTRTRTERHARSKENNNPMDKSTHVTVKNTTFIDVVRTNWPLVSFLGTIVVVLFTMYFDLKSVKAQSIENKTDIRSIEGRVSGVEGDIKAIRQGIEYLVNQEQ